MNEGLKFQKRMAEQLKQYTGISNVTVGLHGVDITTDFLALECKQEQHPKYQKAVAQAKVQNHSSARWAAAITQKTGKTCNEEPYVHMTFDTFLNIVKTLKDLGYAG